LDHFPTHNFTDIFLIALKVYILLHVSLSILPRFHAFKLMSVSARILGFDVLGLPESRDI
jgi:hypothetical protein